MSDTPRMQAAQMTQMEHGTGDVWRVGCDIERELNAANVEIEEKRKDVVYLATEKAKLEELINRLEEAGDVIKASLQRSLNSNEQGECKWLAELPMTDAEFAVFTTAFKAKETKP